MRRIGAGRGAGRSVASGRRSGHGQRRGCLDPECRTPRRPLRPFPRRTGLSARAYHLQDLQRPFP